MFEGWLIKFGNVVLPNRFILADGWNSVPNQRIDIDAYRDANVLLHRETSKNYKTSLKLNLGDMNLKEMEAFKTVIGLATLEINDRNQRKLSVTYWNDEELAYSHAQMYMTDTEYSIHTVDEVCRDIEYNSFTIELIEY